MKSRTKVYLTGTFVIIVLCLLGTFLLVNSYIYRDVKKVKHDLFNLYNQVKTTNSKIDQFNVADEDIAKQSAQFSEATKKWQMQQNNEFKFQFKSPAGWGALDFQAWAGAEENWGIAYTAKFPHPKNGQALVIFAQYYDFQPENDIILANKDVHQLVLDNKAGECSEALFSVFKQLNIGEIRNCFVRENILQQKFLVYRYVQEEKSQLNVVYPRKHFYVSIPLTEIDDEIDYFIQSMVFME